LTFDILIVYQYGPVASVRFPLKAVWRDTDACFLTLPGVGNGGAGWSLCALVGVEFLALLAFAAP
jgi:hypothetical protein